MLEIKIDNRNGNVWDVSQIVSGVQWKTSRIGKPGSLDITLIRGALYQDRTFRYNNGDIVTVRKDGRKVFFGYIFSIDGGKDESVKIKAYDQMRYLLNTDTYVFSGATATDILRKIAADFNLKLGTVEDTGYRIPTMVEDGQKLLDILCKALDLTLINSGRNYVLFDDFGALTIRNVESMLLDFVVGDGSLMYDYQTKTSIDSDTYNRIKLYQDNQDTGRREVYMAQDSANIARWGVLQLYQSVEENMNRAQIEQLLDTLATLKNRETKSLKISALGDIRVRAGSYIRILIEDQGINQPMLVDECQHNFDGADHTMSLELKVIE
jgi:uncharacterized protein YerC